MRGSLISNLQKVLCAEVQKKCLHFNFSSVLLKCKCQFGRVSALNKVWEKIENVAEADGGIIRTSQVEKAGVSRPVIGKYVRDGKLERVRKGIYIISQGDHDEFALIQAQHSQAVFSFGTALFLWGMSDRTPHFIDVTFPQGVNASVIRRDNPDLRCHYVQARLYGIGIAEKRSPQGAMVRLYDRERCICDLVRGKNILDAQLYSQALKEYFKSRPDIEDPQITPMLA